MHIEGIVLRGISRTGIEREYNFEVGNTTTNTYTHTAQVQVKMSGLSVIWLVNQCNLKFDC